MLPYVGGMPLPDHMSEVDYAGALTGRAIECVRAETVDVLVPATAEIVVEGNASRADTAPEGPMGEYAGYLWDGPPTPKPVYHVSAVTHRTNPILPISVAGEPPEENHTAWGIPNAGEIVHLLRAGGFPVTTAWSPLESANHWFAVAVEHGWRDRFPDKTTTDMCDWLGQILFTQKGGIEAVGTRPVFTPAQQAERARAAAAYMSKAFVRYGLTSVHHEGGDLAALQAIRARGDLLHRVSYEAYPPFLDAMIAGGLETGFGDEWIRLGATAEHTIDGSFSERTLARSTPYPGRTPPYYGNITETQDALDAWVEKVQRAGIQVNCHANGDVAIGMMLTAVERAQKAFPLRDARPKITHCTLINDDLVRRIKAAGAIPAPFTSYAYYNADKFKFYGEALMQHCMAFRSFLDAGIPVCAGSDYDPGPFAPLMGMQGMVTRTGWNGETWGANQRITAAEALRVNTLNGAHASREEAIKGSITPGKLADFVILADDPLTIAPERIKDIKVVRTVTGGRTVYKA